MAVKPKLGGTCGPKGSLKALLGRPWGRGALRPNCFFDFFCLSDLLVVLDRFFFFVIFLLLSFCDHHFLSSCEAHSLNPCTTFCFHLCHIPTHPPAPSLRMFRLVFPSKSLLYTLSCAYIGLPCAVQCAVAQEDNSGHVMKEKIRELES